jgi:hypothetical protein
VRTEAVGRFGEQFSNHPYHKHGFMTGGRLIDSAFVSAGKSGFSRWIFP